MCSTGVRANNRLTASASFKIYDAITFIVPVDDTGSVYVDVASMEVTNNVFIRYLTDKGDVVLQIILCNEGLQSVYISATVFMWTYNQILEIISTLLNFGQSLNNYILTFTRLESPDS